METSSSTHFLTSLLLFFTFTSCIASTSAATASVAASASTEFIKTSCGNTTYPQLCISSLSSRASAIQTSPKLLAQESLSVTLESTQATTSTMARLAKSHGLTPREVGAMRDCVEEVRDSVDQLRKSMGEMGQIRGSNFGLMMSDIQTWVSAALTNEDTCTEGFEGGAMNGAVKNAIRGRIVTIAHLTSNALALINSYAALNG